MTFPLIILAFALMIFIHELGHFLTARAFGVGIEKFSIGFGRPIAEFESKGISWRIGWIPLGGYVKMMGENPDDEEADDSLSFRKKAWWKKLLIAFSGPFANLVLGFVLFIVSFLLPLNVEDQLPVIHKAEGKWTELFAPGDSLHSVNGKPIPGYLGFLEQLKRDAENIIVLNRGSELLTLRIAGIEVDSLAVSLYPVVSTRIGDVIPKTPAYHANLQTGDVITAVDSIPVADWYAMRELIVDSPRDSVKLNLTRGSTSFERTLRLEGSLATGTRKAIGIMQSHPVKYVRHFNPLEAVQYGTYNAFSFITLNYQMLGKLVARPSELRKSVGGPVLIATLGQQVGQKGFSYLLLFFGSISLMLMIMNLLPIPILDGGHIFFALIEAVTGRPVPTRVQSFLQYLGFLILITLGLFVFYSDLSSVLFRYWAR